MTALNTEILSDERIDTNALQSELPEGTHLEPFIEGTEPTDSVENLAPPPIEMLEW